MKINRIAVTKLLIIILLILCEKCFYLINIDNLYSTFIFLNTLVLIIVMYFPERKIKLKSNERFMYYFFILSIFIAVVAAIRANMVYNQPYLMSLVRLRTFFIVLLYFPIKKFINNKKERIDFIFTVIMRISNIAVVTYFIQYLLANNVVFLQVKIGSRFSSMRFRFEEFLSIIAFFMVCSAFLKAKLYSDKILNGILLVIYFIYYIDIIKGRLQIIGLVVGLFAFLFIFYRSKIKIFIYMLVAILIFLIIPIPIVNIYIDSIKSDLNRETGNTLTIRESGRKLYIEHLDKHNSYMWGDGIVNDNWEEAALESGLRNYIYMVDNGIFGVIYYFGIIGAIWCLLLYSKLLLNSYKCLKQDRSSIDIGFGVSVLLFVTVINIPFITYTFAMAPILILIAISDSLLNWNLKSAKVIMRYEIGE